MYKIHPDDEMYSYLRSLEHKEADLFSIYMNTGFVIWSGLKNILKDCGHPLLTLNSVLDLPSGYGRILRFIKQDISSDLITACDIYPNAVDFLKREFSVRGFVSEKDPKNLAIPGSFSVIFSTFSVIFSISLFSHLPSHLFEQWFKKLIDLCAPMDY